MNIVLYANTVLHSVINGNTKNWKAKHIGYLYSGDPFISSSILYTYEIKIRERIFTPFFIENAHSIDFGDFDIVVYLEKNHSFITLFLQSDKYTFRKMGVFNEKRCNLLFLNV